MRGKYMSGRDSLGDRMKTYESVNRNYLTRRTPVIIRIDGKAFHSFTKGMKKPFDEIMQNTMKQTMKYLCENIQGCKLGYTQSDEISLLLTDYETIDTQAWFDYNIQKMASVSASMATMAFNRFFRENVEYIMSLMYESWNPKSEDIEYLEKMENKFDKAMFDSRVFNLPNSEVTNYFIWRQQDSTRNSIQSVGRAYFTHKELDCKNCNDIQDMLFIFKGINWNDLPTYDKRGCCCTKVENINFKNSETIYVRSGWEIDDNIPIFTQDRNYVERFV